MADCSLFNPAACVENVVTGAVQNGTVELAKAMMEGYDGLLKTFITSWLGQGVLIDLGGSSTDWFKTSLSLVNVFLISLGLIIAGAQTAYLSRGEPFRDVMHALGRVLLVTAAGSMFVQIFVAGGNAFAKWILDSAGTSATGFAVAVGLYLASPGVALIAGFFGIMSVIFQWGLMFVRGALLPLLNAFWPTAAAAAMLKNGSSAFEKLTTWILAFILYSPLAASIYALAWRMKSGDEGVGGVINGLILIVLAIVTLPALLRLLPGAAAVLGRAAGGTMALGVTAGAVTAGIAAGSIVATGGASGAASASGTAAQSGAVAKGAGGAAGASTSGSEATGTAGSGDPSKGAGSDASGSSTGGESPTESGATSAGSSTSSGTDAGGTGGGSLPSASGSSDVAWKAASGALNSGDSSGDNTAEGMISE